MENNVFFEYPNLLYLEFILLPMLILYLYREIKGKTPYIIVPSLAPYKSNSGIIKRVVRHIPFVLEMIAVAAIIVAIARPRSSSTFEKVDTEGIDIILSMDVSISMRARDFTPDRINAAKDIASKFVAERPSDRMGVVVFAGESYTQCPMTTDRATLINLIKEIQTGLIHDGTAIGNGLATAVARMKDSNARSRVVILLTDGVNNSGEVAPQTAAEIAKTYGIRVYTIGVGANGTAPYPVMTPWGVDIQNVPVEIDEDLLKGIAQTTGGRYFRATDNTKLAEIYSEINKMEKSRTTIDSFPVYKELFGGFGIAALVCLLLELVVRLLIRRMP